ncbi:glycerol-3-phosphate dehydrogenase [Iodobacter sp. HSC-16F04]|uniref:Glycerol-3-phosphate dehydrogenase n=1 Tax=Iodobacter violaceini TaxID=3044271 RepID=A0ABX0KTN4_9NEIS|nr:glycerol-3-phosphate dehydrogenase [Iodobacter violacea]
MGQKSVEDKIYDVLVVGGGINGAGIARDAAGRGLSVCLCEKDDLAQHTSSASSKLIHGGLRYLEYYEFGLVRKALQEREVLLDLAPHIIWPLRFVMPHDPTGRPKWLIRTGLFLYDHLASRKVLRGTESIRFDSHASGQPLKAGYSHGFAYSDGWVQDARLVVLNVMDAAERGAVVHTQTACVAAKRENGVWHCTLQGANGVQQVKARTVVNAAGAWVESVLKNVVGQKSAHALRLVKGSHIVVKKLFDHPDAYIFQNPDKRIIFAIPYEKDFTLIGTTDVEYHADPARVSIDHDEISYLCQMSNRYFEQQISPNDVVATFSGVRPLLDDASGNAASVTRDYSLEFDPAEGLLSVFGGKITTYRKLAEQAVDLLAPHLGNHHAIWSATKALPGGDLHGSFEQFMQKLAKDFAWMPGDLLQRYARTYGSRTAVLLKGARCVADLGEEILPALYAAEVRYLMQFEWAKSAEDILWRRTKLRLHLPANADEILSQWLAKTAVRSTDTALVS